MGRRHGVAPTGAEKGAGTYYSIGQISELLGVKPHILRYWERCIPLIAPRKNAYGRRVYGSYEVNLVFRVRHLLHEARYTVDGACLRLWRDAEQVDPQLRAGLAEIRDDLVEALVSTRVARRTLEEQFVKENYSSSNSSGDLARKTGLGPNIS